MSTKKVIAVDGPAASGKGTLARRIAKELNYAYMDTGLLYRAVGFEIKMAGSDPENEVQAITAAESMMTNFTLETLKEPRLRTDTTGQFASKVAAIQGVRDVLLDLQHNFAQDPGEGYEGAILDGRDIGSVICPNADAKIFVIAQVEKRAQRRHKELQSLGFDVKHGAVLKDMRERDARDSSRDAAPMAAARDAFILDTTALTPEAAYDEAMAYIREKIQ